MDPGLSFAGTVVENTSITDSTLVVKVRRKPGCWSAPADGPAGLSTTRPGGLWRHVDFGAATGPDRGDDPAGRLPRLRQVRTEWMLPARPGARHTRDFEDMAAVPSTRMSKATVAILPRTNWQTINPRHPPRHTHLATDRLEHLHHIGVDEIAYREEPEA